MIKKTTFITALHILSFTVVIGTFIIAALAYIHNGTAYIDVLGHEYMEIGRCYYRDTFNIGCPTCGLTRSFISIFNLEFAQSVRYNRTGIFVFLLFFLLLIFNISGILKGKYTGSIGKVVAVYGFLVCLLVIGNWAINLVSIL